MDAEWITSGPAECIISGPAEWMISGPPVSQPEAAAEEEEEEDDDDDYPIDENKFTKLLNGSGGDDWHVSRLAFSSGHGLIWEHRGCSFSNNELMDALSFALCKLDSAFFQIWVPPNDGDRSYFTTFNQPFGLTGNLLNRGMYKFRECCMSYRDHLVNEGVGEDRGIMHRVYTNGYPETSPDLLYYSEKEHPFRDEAIRCAFKEYAAFPIFHRKFPSGDYQFVCTMELYTCDMLEDIRAIIDVVEDSLETAGLYTTIGSFSGGDYRLIGDDEIDEVFKSAINAVPELLLAQVYTSDREYSNPSLIYMRRNAFSIMDEGGMNQCSNNHMVREFIHASKSYIVRSDNLVLLPSTNIPCLFCQNLSELSINIYPLAHYARHARLSFYFAICLVDKQFGDMTSIFEFFFHLKSREEENPSSILRLLLQIMENKLKSYKTPSGRSLGEEIVVELRTEDNTHAPFEFNTPISYPIHEITTWAKDPKLNITWTGVGCETDISTTFVVENCFNELKTPMGIPTTISLVLRDSLYSPISQIQEMIKSLLNNMTSKLGFLSQCLVQFWAPKQLENKPYLVTFDQAFAIGYRLKELFVFRKRCEAHRYFINDGGMEEGLGPPGRVFQYRVPEYTPDLRLYSSREFPLREYAVHFDLRVYLALPVFYDLNGEFKDQCAGVLEFVGSKQLTSLPKKDVFFEEIRGPLQEVNLKLPHSSDKFVVRIRHGDVMNMFHDIPHLVHVDVWAPCNQCNDNNCMQLQKPHHYPIDDFGFMLNSNRENKGKGIIGMVLASERKACFCANLCGFSITEDNRAHVLHRARLTVCFAICLHSSYTGDMPYVFEFFLDQGCKRSGNLCLFLRSLLPMMKEKLKRFRASLERLIGDELVIDVITFGSVSEHDSFRQRELNDPPVRFNIIPHRQQGHVQQTPTQITNDVCDELHSSRGVTGVEQNNTYCSDLNTGADVMEGEQQSNTVYGNLNTRRDATETCMELHPNGDAMEDQQINPIHVDSDKEVAAVSKEKGSKDNRRLFNITYEELEPHFGKPLKEVAEIIGASKATLKRRLPELGIKRWPWHPKYINDPSLFMALTQRDHVGTFKRPRVVDSTGSNSTLSNKALHQQPIQDANTRERNQNVVESAGNEVVTIKATFEEDTVMFELSASSKMDQLNREVARKFDIEVGNFKLKYLDEDGDRIVLRHDDDLNLCIRNMKRLGKTTSKVFVESIHK